MTRGGTGYTFGADGTPVSRAGDTFSAPSFRLPIGFAGGLGDPLTGLVRFGLRDLDPDAGRWTAHDPIGFAGGEPNLYAYIGNAPVAAIDPSGLTEISVGYATPWGLGAEFGLSLDGSAVGSVRAEFGAMTPGPSFGFDGLAAVADRISIKGGVSGSASVLGKEIAGSIGRGFYQSVPTGSDFYTLTGSVKVGPLAGAMVSKF